MKTLFIALTVLAFSATAFAYPGPDSMGLYLDADAAAPHSLTFSTTAPFQSVTLYLVISNPSLGGVSGWEAAVNIVGTPTAPAWTLAAGLDVDSASDTSTYQQFQVGIGVSGTSPGPIMPNGSGNCLIASWTGFVLAPTDELQFFITGVPGSVSFAGTPGYASPTNAGLLQAAFDNTSPLLPNFCINTDCMIIGNQDLTFSNVKALYR